MISPRLLAAFVAALSSLVLAFSASGQASFAEGFNDTGATEPGTDGPANLIAKGWIFRNQSVPKGTSSWFGSGPTQAMSQYEGSGFLANSVQSTTSDSGSAISNWAIVPEIPGQVAGDTVRFFVQASLYTGRRDRLQVRYSPSSGTATGSGVEGVGDFTTVLLDIDPLPREGEWVAQQVQVPGPGRIAFRYYLPVVGSSSSYGGFFGIDALVVGREPRANLPLPLPGETVRWTAAMSPIVIDGIQHLPEGGTVIVDPGVKIQINRDSTLVVRGTLRGTGTPEQPIVVESPGNTIPALEVNGTLDFDYATIRAHIRPDSGGALLFANSRFEAPATLFTSGSSAPNYRRPFLSVARSHFEGVDLYTADLTAVVLDSTIGNGSLILSYIYPYLKNVGIDGGTLSLSKDYQPVYLNNVTVRNSAGAGLSLGGGNWGNDYFLGPDVVLQNNQQPISLGDGGLLPGSTVPRTGNRNNYIAIVNSAELRGPVTWSNTGLPYVITGFPMIVGSWNILPGTAVRLGPEAGINDKLRSIQARGLPDQPVTFERFDPAQPWDHIKTIGRLENALLAGSRFGVVNGGLDRPRYVDSSILRDNGRALTGSMLVRGTQFIGNGTAAFVGFPGDLDGRSDPNSFTANVTGVAAANDARGNWWGSPTGPRSPENPGGTGDTAAAGVPVVPYRTLPPDYTNHAPIVHLNKPAFVLEPGKKVMLTWDARDDGSIASQRIVFSPAGDYTGNGPTVANLPGTQRAFEWTVPDIGYQTVADPASIRIVAVDDAGREGWDAADVVIPSGEVRATLRFTTAFASAYRAGDLVDVCWSLTDETNSSGDNAEVHLLLDGDHRSIYLGGTTTNCLPSPLVMPYVSTDLARVGVKVYRGNNRIAWFMSQPFSIRPDARVPDAAPTTAVQSPSGGAITSGSVVPIRWTAADDEGLRSFDIIASYDEGRTWHIIARDLPATARSYDWQTAPGSGFGSVQLRVIARDLRFQNTSALAGAEVIAPSQPLNISTRGRVATGDRILIAGTIITGNVAKKVIFRAVGPSLAGANVGEPLQDPVLELYGAGGALIATNDNWKDTQQADIEASGLEPARDSESAIVATLQPGNYTAIVRGKAETEGVALAELYELDRAAGSKLANISTRGFVDRGDNAMIAGVILGPEAASVSSVILRAIGPSLRESGVANPLGNPTLVLHDRNGNVIKSNDNWQESADRQTISDRGLAPGHSDESAIFATLAPGNYTAVLRGFDESSGVAVVEAYHLE